MSGTKEGSRKAVANILAKNPNFYKEIGGEGGRNGKGEDYKGGFASSHELAVRAGRIGGTISKRTKKDAKIEVGDISNNEMELDE